MFKRLVYLKNMMTYVSLNTLNHDTQYTSLQHTVSGMVIFITGHLSLLMVLSIIHYQPDN